MNKEQIYELLQSIKPTFTKTEIHTTKSLGYVLADDIYSSVNIPPANTSMRDGYAVRSNGNSNVFKIVGETRAGNNLQWVLNPGEAVYITTGGIVPENCDSIVMIEFCNVNMNTVSTTLPIIKNQWIRMIGDDVLAGSLILSKDTKITYDVIGLLVSVGMNIVPVYKKLNIGILSTGDEIIDIDKSNYNINKNYVYDTNKPMISSYLMTNGFFAIDLGHLVDDEEVVYQGLSKYVEQRFDVLITSGGVSMGDKDFIKRCLVRLNAGILVEKTNLKPGKPMILSKVKDTVIFSLPGNPVSSITSVFLFLVPYLKNDYSFTKVSAYIKESVKPDVSRLEYMRGVVEYSKKMNCFYVKQSTKNQMSSNIQSMINSNCLMEIHPGNELLPVGKKIDIIVYGNYKEYTEKLVIGVLTMSDRASTGVYEDKSGKEIINFIEKSFDCEYSIIYKLISDDPLVIEKTLLELTDSVHCHLILTTGGTGPDRRDNTVEITERVCHKLLPGFGEVMRLKNFDKVPTSILSAQTAGIRYISDSVGCLIVNLPGSPKSIRECLEIVVNSFPMCSKIIGSPIIKLH